VQTVAPLSLEIGSKIEDTLPQYAARYYELPVNGQRITVAFRGQRQTPLLPTEPASGTHCWWSNQGDSIDATLTGQFNLPPDSPLTLEYAIWYEIEEGWDFGYVEVSTDGGATWDILEGEHTFKQEPKGNAFGKGYTGISNGWLRESIDLSYYAGRSVLLRFEYITDDAIHGPGFCIDDISITGIAFFDDAETDFGAWAARGFIRAASHVPQAYVIRLIQVGERTVVSDIPIGTDGTVTMGLGGPASEFEKAVLIIAAASDGTMQPALFEMSVSQ
jgi:bacillopeptidase F (M6 metalloprotease family)